MEDPCRQAMVDGLLSRMNLKLIKPMIDYGNIYKYIYSDRD